MKGNSLIQMSMKGSYVKAVYSDEAATPTDITSWQGSANGGVS